MLQQTGMPFIMMQQQQPAFIMAVMQSQQAWIMSQQALSPEVQVIMQPSAVISHLQVPIIMLQDIMVMPFIIMQQFIMPPAIIFIMFCIMERCIMSSQTQVIFMPPSHFSIFMVHRGIIIMPFMAGIIMGMPAGIMAVIGISGIVLVMLDPQVGVEFSSRTMRLIASAYSARRGRVTMGMRGASRRLDKSPLTGREFNW